MSKLLYYPHYSPSTLHLRSMLLFFDQVHLIVPWVDQGGVRDRDHIKEIMDSHYRAIDFHAPEDGYGRWANDDQAIAFLSRLIVAAEAKNKNLPRNSVRLNAQGRLLSGAQRFAEERFAEGWKPIAAQKFPPHVLDMIVGSGMGVGIGHYVSPTTGNLVEHDCIITIPEIADFVLCRLSKEISSHNGLPTMTFSEVGYVEHTFKRFSDRHLVRQDLLKILTPLVIPSNLDAMDMDTYLDVRNAFGNFRMSIHNHLNSLVTQHDLDSEASAAKYYQRLQEASDAISKEIAEVELWLRERRFTGRLTFGIGLIATAIAGVLGTMTGGPIGGLLSAGGMYAAERLATKLLVGETESPSPTAHALARLRGSIHPEPRMFGLRSPIRA
jgi:hypothetical protein